MSRKCRALRERSVTASAIWMAGLAIALGARAVEDNPRSTLLLAIATEELQKLTAFDDTPRSMRELLVRNTSRYFALYEVPTSPYGFSQLLGTVIRVGSRFAVDLYEAAQAAARSTDSQTVGRAHVDAAIEQLLPGRSTEYHEIVFFPHAPASEQIVVEQVDLEAFRDTGIGWQLLGELAASDLLVSEQTLPAEPEAARRLGEVLAAYGLLVLRLGGAQAQADYARFVHSPHLREAAKSIAERAELRSEESPPDANQAPETYFHDVAKENGVRFRHVTSDWLSYRRRYGPSAPSFSGGGVTAADLDGDDWSDLIFCGGRGCSAFRNRHDGSFEDMTLTSGLNVVGEARMAVVADLDNDGKKDVFITYARDTNRLFRGLGQRRFRDITVGSGLEDEGNISGPATAVDYDNDGDLDLYVGNFGDYMQNQDPWQTGDARNALPNRLYRNLGDFKFEDVTETASVGNTGWTQALSHLDFDRDGDQDLYIANDFGRNDLLVNNGDGTFSSLGETTGSDDPFHGMNAAFADLNRDGYADIFVTNIWTWNAARNAVTETNSLLLSSANADGVIRFQRHNDPSFLGHDTGWSWAALFLDHDNDGDDDLYVVNGFTDYHTFRQFRPNPEIPEQLWATNNGRGPNFFFRNNGGLQSVVADSMGTELADENSRSVALLDYDRDGDLDMAVSTFHSYAHLFRNDGAPRENHWLIVELVGDPSRGTSRDAIGTVVIARNDQGLYVWRQRTGGEGYLGMSDSRLHLGLGTSTSVDLEVIWPGLQRQEFHGLRADQRVRIRQGAESAEILPWR